MKPLALFPGKTEQFMANNLTLKIRTFIVDLRYNLF